MPIAVSFALERAGMRLLIRVLTANRRALALGLLLTGSLVFLSAQKKFPFSPHEKAYYADPSVVEYVQPGLTITIVSAKIASDGTISVDYRLADPNGAPLDQSGVVTPGPISLSFLAAYIPKGQEQYMSYIVRTAMAVSGGASATQATSDSGGTRTTVATGEYVYTYATKAPSGFDATATNRIGIYGFRNLTEWDLGTNYSDTTYDFVQSAFAHAVTNTDPKFGESCDVCHGTGAQFSATQVHAGQ